ncbi:PAS domain S-box-containing protein [Flavobacterium sp. 28YEA47A]|uniref:PAS domain-containing protein n=1 Tax=Flavobacterium sp. 28YEA47A TaxID=3156276 RepID=UPI0035156635
MLDLNEYENAQKEHSAMRNGIPMPLYSWDFFGDYLEHLKIILSDLSKLKTLSKSNQWKFNWNFEEELQKDHVVVVTDSFLNIVFASENIIGMTGYASKEVLGKSPKLFQGAKTSKNDLKLIREAINAKIPFEKTITNYKKNGETYSCHIKAFPVFNRKKQVINFIAFEKAA